MEKGSELWEDLKEREEVIGNRSWFKDTPHYWAEASLRFAYAVACVEVVSEKSKKGREVYDKIVEAWSDPGMSVVFGDIGSMIPESGKEKIKEALIHPETALSPDPNKPFKEVEGILNDIEINEGFLKDDDLEKASLQEREHARQLGDLTWLMMEFVKVGFNRESDIEEGRYRVEVSEQHPWLLWAIGIRTLFDSYRIRFEDVRDFYKVRKYKGKKRDFYKVLSEQPMSRLHREIVASAKAADLKLKNDKTIMKAALRWYKCRVVYKSTEEFCDNEPEIEISLDPKNIDRQIRPCDDAVGYIRRLPRKRK